MLRKLQIGRRLRKRIMETYRETKNIVKVGKRRSEEFWTKSGVRQGCPISPALFNAYGSDLEAEMRKEQTGGIVVGRKKFWTIAYADDMVLLAKSEQELREMIRRFKRYLERKGLYLSPEKSKVMVFERGGGGRSRREWKWGDENIEEVKEMKYLGYVMQKNGGSEKHIEDRMRRATIAMKQIWSIGERLFKEDFGRRMKMFDSIVGSIALYGAEVWGWRNDERLDKVKKKYVKWILGLDRRTPNYILIEETKMRELRLEALKRAIKYEETARKSKKKIVRECIREIDREGGENEEHKWRRRRGEVLERLELTKNGLEERRKREEPERITREMMKGIERMEKEERRKKIGESRYNEYYRSIITEGVPKYLQGRKKKKARNVIARYRCGNEMKGSQYWREEEDR
ncbi:uncharacterized protein [Temnothorax nylanderi]|uniref:uncharacterized protein n=1 Tax=Temnothorax nylanderi TaxID=102681 RepID=UPI003A84022D